LNLAPTGGARPRPHFVSVPETGEYELLAPFDCGEVVVPAGFRTNGASIPRVLWPFLGSPFGPDVIGAAFEHDYAYRFGVPSQREADRRFLATLRRDGIGQARSRLMWLGVRAFGWLYWRRCRYGRGIAG
jgi:hypothetical protein